MGNFILLIIDNSLEYPFLVNEFAEEFLPYCHLQIADSVPQGLALVSEKNVDVIIVDLQNPLSEGVALCQQLKQSEKTLHVPVLVIIPPGASLEFLNRIRSAGVDDFCSHPLDAATLAARIKILLRLKNAEEELRCSSIRLKEQAIIQANDLREKEKRFHSLFHDMNEGFALHEMICDDRNNPIDYRFLEMNPAFERLTGLRASEVRGKTVLEILPNTESYWIETYGKVALTGISTKFEHFSKEFDRYYQVMAYCPQKYQFAVIFEDITERKKMEEVLRESEEKFRASFENANVGVCLVNMDGKILNANQTLCQMMGYTRSELETLSVEDIAHPDDRMLSQTFIQKVISGEIQTGVFDKRYVHKNGKIVWGHVSSSLIRDAHQNSLYFISHVQDITEHMQADLALKSSEEKFSKAFQHAPILMTISTLEDGTFLEVNDRFVEISGFSRQEALGKTAVELGWIDSEERQKIIRAIQNQGYVNDLELAVRTKEGKNIDCLYAGEVITVNGVPRLLSQAMDITVRKQYIDERDMTLKLLGLINSGNDQFTLIRLLTHFLQQWSGCEAVGIRLRDGDDYPYFETLGFSSEFVQKEKYLCAYDPQGEPIRDSQGNPVLECMCGNVLYGRFNPDLPFFTPNGSFWSNNTTELLASTTENDRLARTRNRCNGEGYESVALIPLRSHNKILGLLQFNDRHTNRFTPELIDFLERTANNIALSLEQRLTQAQLKESEARYRSLFDETPLSIWEEDFSAVKLEFDRLKSSGVLDFRAYFQTHPEVLPHYASLIKIIDINQESLFFFDVPSKDHLSKNLPRYFDEESWPVFLEEIVALAEGKTRFDSEIAIRDLSGHRRYLFFRLSVSPAYADSLRRVLVSFIDITERKQFEEALRLSEEKFSKAFQLAPEAITLSRLSDGMIVEFNEGFCRLSEYSREETLGRTTHELNLWANPQDRQQFITALREQGAVSGHEYTYRGKSGRIINCLVSGDIITIQNEIHALTIVHDITQRKKAEIALQEQIRFNKIFLDSMPCVALLLSPHTRTIVAANATAMKLGALPGTPCYASWLCRETPCPWCLAPELWETLLEQHREVRNNGVIWDAHWLPVSHDLYLHYAFDISEKRQLENQLFHVQKMEAIGTLAGGIAHDFNNILAGIIGFTQLSINQCKADESLLREHLTIVFDAGLRAKQLVQQILAFSRKNDMEKKAFPIASMIKEGLKLLRSTLPTTIEIQQDIEDPSLTILGDATQIHQVLMNLCTNASHAMQQNGGILKVSLQSIDREEIHDVLPYFELQAGPHVCLQISDTGHGIDPSIQQFIFDPFFTTKKKTEGTGLGLSVVLGIVKSHGGAISLTSSPEQGTTFKLYFPMTSQTAPVENKSISLPQGQGQRFLLVDDEEILINLGVRMLKSLGYHVVSYVSSMEALQAFRLEPNRFDMILTDLTMPKLTGIQLAKEIHAIRPDLPIMIYTGYGDRLMQENLIESGVCEILMKPLMLHELAHACAKHLKSSP